MLDTKRLSAEAMKWGIFLLLCVHGGYALGQYHFEIREFGEGSGYLNTGAISDIRTDRQNQIWIVRFQGVTRYDGNSFTDIESSYIKSPAILRFHESESGKPFVVDMLNQVFFIERDSLFPHPMNDTIRKLTPRGSMMDVRIDEQDRLHLSVRGHKYLLFDRDGKVSFPMENLDRKMRGLVCVLSEKGDPFMLYGGQKRFESDTLDSFYLFDSNLHLIDQAAISSIGQTSMPSVVRLANGNFLCAIGQAPMMEFNTHKIVDEHQNKFRVFSLLADRSNNLWVSTLSNGIHYYPNQQYSPDQRVVIAPKGTSAATAQDFQGGIWVHSSIKGLTRIGYPFARQYQSEIGLKADESLISVDYNSDHLITSTYKRLLPLLNLKDGSLKALNYTSPTNSVIEVLNKLDQGELWVSEWGGISVFSHNKWRAISMELALEKAGLNPKLRDRPFFIADRLNTKYDLTCVFRNRYVRVKNQEVSYVSPRFPRALYNVLVTGDSTWITTEVGLFLQLADTIIDMKVIDPAFGAIFQQAIWFQGKIWLASLSKGAFVLDEKGITPITIAGERLVRPLFFEKDEHELWMHTRGRTVLFSGLKPPNHATNTHMSEYAPLPNWPIRGYATTDSTLYFACEKKGLLAMEFSALKKRSFQPPDLWIERVTINDSVCPSEVRSFNLKHNENFINVSFIGLNYSKERVFYRYRMPGIRDNWKVTEETSLQFVRLPPGSYDIEIQARLQHQPWGESQFLHFAIAQPFWTTWWFLGLMFCALGGTIFLVVQQRHKRQEREQKLTIKQLTAEQKALQAQLDSHYLFNAMASVHYLVLEGDNKRTVRFLNMFTQLLRSTLDHTRSNGISISDEIQFLKDYMDMERFRLEERFEYTIEQASVADWLHTRIPAFALQPFVENAINHGLKNKMEKGHLSLRFLREGELLQVVITDNGVGRKAAAHFRPTNGTRTRTSHSINIIKERLELHNNRSKNVVTEDLFAEDGSSAGTRITVIVKANKE